MNTQNQEDYSNERVKELREVYVFIDKLNKQLRARN